MFLHFFEGPGARRHLLQQGILLRNSHGPRLQWLAPELRPSSKFSGPVLVASPQGGMDIEEVAEKHPDAIFTVS